MPKERDSKGPGPETSGLEAGEARCPKCGGRMTPPEIDRRAMRARQICYPCGHQVSTPVKLGPATKSWCGQCKDYRSPDCEVCPHCGTRCLLIRSFVPDRGGR